MTGIHSMLIVGGASPFKKDSAIAVLLEGCGMCLKWEEDASENDKKTSGWAYFVKNADEMWAAAQKCKKNGGAVFFPFRDGCVVADITGGGSAFIKPGGMALPADVLINSASEAAVFSKDKRCATERLCLIFWASLMLSFCGTEKISVLSAADQVRKAIQNL